MNHFLHGKTAAITGGSGTIGLAMARALLSPMTCRGSTDDTTIHNLGVSSLILIGRSLDKLRDAQAALRPTSPHQTVSIFRCDVSNESNVVELFQSLDQQFTGGIDLWINNAGEMRQSCTIGPSQLTRYSRGIRSIVSHFSFLLQRNHGTWRNY